MAVRRVQKILTFAIPDDVPLLDFEMLLGSALTPHIARWEDLGIKLVHHATKGVEDGLIG